MRRKTRQPDPFLRHPPRGRTLILYASIRTDLENAGAAWVDREVVVDQGLVTSRNPGDLDAFCAKIIEEFAEGVHPSSAAAPERGRSIGFRAAIAASSDRTATVIDQLTGLLEISRTG